MLGIVPENADVTIFADEKTDAYGQKVPATEGKVYSCRQSINTENKAVLLPDSSEYLYQVSFLFNGFVPVIAGNTIEFTNDQGELQKKKIKAVQYKRDFSNNVLAVKAVI